MFKKLKTLKRLADQEKMKVVLLCLVFFLSVVGCKQPIKNPHLSDPLYLSYRSQMEENRKSADKVSDEISKFKKTLDAGELARNEKQVLLEGYFEKLKSLEKLNQQRDYLVLKMNERQKEASALYIKAFKENKPWPDPLEVQAFETERRLAAKQGKEWDVRVRMKELLPKKTDQPTNATPPSSHH